MHFLSIGFKSGFCPFSSIKYRFKVLGFLKIIPRIMRTSLKIRRILIKNFFNVFFISGIALLICILHGHNSEASASAVLEL